MELTSKLCQSCLRVNESVDAISFCPSCDEFLCPTCTAAHRLNKVTLSHAYQLIDQSPCESCKRGGRNKSTTAWCTECSEPLCMTCADAHKRNKCTLQHEVIFVSTGYEIYRRKGQNIDDKDEFRPPSSSYRELSLECTDVKNKVKELIEMNEQNEKKLTVQEKEVIYAIADVKQEIESKVLQLESVLKNDLLFEIDKCKHSYSAQKEELLKIQKYLEDFLQHLESMENYDFSNKNIGTGENLTKELSSIKHKLETTEATLQRFNITLANTKVIRIQKLGSVAVKTENYICKTNGIYENRQGHINEPNKRMNVHEPNNESQSLDLCSKIERSSLHLYRQAGRSGRVWRATFEGSTVAVKKNIENDHDAFGKEANILMVASHENVIKMIGVSIDQLPYFLVMQYLTEYSLKEVILNEPVEMDTSMKNMTEMISKIANGMNYLGSREIIHSDLRANNILFGSNWNPKVCGFKFAHIVNDLTIDHKRRHLKDPEVFKMIKGDFRHPRPECCPEQIYDHALNCWSKDPDARITFEFISHFFYDYDICTEHGYDEVDELDEDEYKCQ
ncbi:unnamed protein product [Mytilus coruscus]|uniref:Uncharacterized protein n=1 Tax=Mytilus coruscus TaxID=42192 RepID=A0A6J8C3C2_MYTCO|nr:unnamed protein product [Mytilus coruscus]